MKIAFVHYNIGHRDGVNTVMRTNALSFLKRYKNSKIYFVGSIVRPLITNQKTRVNYIDIPEMDILGKKKKANLASKQIFDYLKKGMEIYSEIKKKLKNMDYIILENPNLGVHPPATYAYYRLVKHIHHSHAKQKVIYRIHDFAEDRRGNFINMLRFKGTESSPYWHKVMFPRARNTGFVAINKNDLLRLDSHGIIQENRAHYIPNPVNDHLSYDDNKSKGLRKKLIKENDLDKDVKFIFYPARIVPRKNVEEAIFLTQLLNIKFDEKYVLVASLKPKGGEGLKYYNRLNKFVKKHNLPVILGINDLVTMERQYTNSGKIKMYGIGDMYDICDKAISTSTMEGFGLFFIESWFFEKAIIGRDLPEITSDFKTSGINLEHLYNALFIDGSDFKNYGNLSKRLKLVLRLKNAKFFERFEEENKQTFAGLYDPINTAAEKKLIKENRKIVLKEYCTAAVTKQFMDVLRKIPSELEVKEKK
ncbi:hypothetical protein GF361_05235 [Candidatus Woesearchaeota archaeon]|nr:hypothetical protein [Candidatus Woesearchaeota archaeon]